MNSLGIAYATVAAVSALLLTGCGSGNGDSFPGVTTCNLMETTVEVSDIGQYVGSVEQVALAGDDAPLLSGIAKLLICRDGDMIFLTDAGIFRFDKNGNYEFAYGGQGRASGEYLKIYDICISFDEKELMCLNHLNEVLRYELDSGEFVGKTETRCLTDGVPNASGIIPAQDGGFSLFVPNPSDPSSTEEFHCLMTYGPDGTLLAESLERKDFNMDILSIPFVTRDYENSYYIRPQENENILYGVNSGTDVAGNGPEKIMRSFFGKDNIPARFAFRNDRNPWENLTEMMVSDYLKVQFNFFFTSNLLYSAAFGPESGIVNFLVRRDTMEGIRWESGKDATVTPLFVIAADEHCFYVLFDKYGLDASDAGKIADPLLRYLLLTEKISIDEDGNPVIVRIGFQD